MNGWVDFDGIQITLKQVDRAPSITITNPATNQLLNGSGAISISGTASDLDGDGVTVSATINGKLAQTTAVGGNWTLSWDVDTLGIVDGTYTGFNITASDGQGGSNIATYTGNIVIDQTAPTATVIAASTAGGDAWVNSAERTAGFNVVTRSSEATGTLYVVPSGTANNMDAITGAAVGSAASAGAGADTTISISPGNAGIVNGTSYRVYAVDSAGNISGISGVAFTADLTAPTATVNAAVTAGGDALVGITEKAAGFNVVAQSSEATGTLYVVPSGTTNTIGTITAAAVGSAASVGANVDTTIAISAGNSGITDGTYRVYAVDAAGNISGISGIAFTADVTNDAPTLAGGPYTLTGTDENTTSGGTTVLTILNGVTYADTDPSALSGIAVTAKTGNGTWQYSTTGTDGWTAFGAVSSTSALLLTSSTSVRYVPDAANGETATFTFLAWDQTTGTASSNGTPRTADASSTGGTTTFSSNTAGASITVTAVNDAPVLDNSKSPALATIAEDTAAPTNGSTVNSTLVSSLVDIGGVLSNVTDVDSGAVTGIAVIAKSNHGTLYYTTNGGTTWTAAPGTLSAGSALLLAADANTRIAFVPEANLVGTDTDAITFKAWDRTSGGNGDTGVNTGAGSAFSTATDMAPIVITGVNDAPMINAGPYTLTGTNEDAAASSATQIDTIITALGYADVDIGGILNKGIAVTAVTGRGKWQYSTDGSTGWTYFGTVANTAALLLTSDAYVRFVPEGLNGETATFTFRAWDRTATALASVNGTPRYADTSTNDGSSEFSTGTANASITVASVNDAPVFVGGMTTLTIGENSGANSIKALLHASDPDTGQTLTWSESAAPAHGTLTFTGATAATGGGDITPGGTITYTPIANYVGSDSFTVQVSDGTASATRTIDVTLNVVATELRFTTQPSGSVSGVALTGQPVVVATDASGNVDTTFTGNVTLSLGSGAGSLSGTLVKAAVAGVATFTDLAYTATADRQAFTLTTANAAGLTNATSDSVTSDVVATKLRFSTQPAPVTLASTVTRTFTTAPVVQAVDAANVIDLDYSAAIVLSLTKDDGTAAPGTVNSVSGTGDTDGSSTTITLAPTSGAVTFSGLSVRYTHAVSTDSLALHATSGALVAANSAAITCREDAAPVVNTLTTGGTFTEGGASVPVSYAATVTDADDTTCAWATVSIIQNFTAGQDVLSFTNDGSTMGNITAVYDAGTGVLTLTSAGATATKFQWANAVKAVKYANTSDAPNTATRRMVFVANDGYLSSDPAYAYCKTNVTVIATNDAPALSGGPFTLTGTNVDAMSSATPVSTILAGVTYVDPDGSVASGIAVTAKTGNGSWEYSTDGVTWAAIGTVSDNSALLLTSTARIRYLPNGIDAETATITFRAWDQTSGSASTNTTRGLADTSTNGGTTAFSIGTAIAQITVVDNIPPTVTSINRQTPADASTNASNVTYRVTFSESVTGIDIGDFLLVSTGTASGTISSVSATGGTVIDVVVNNLNGTGELRLDLKDAETEIMDANGNLINGGYSGGQVYTVDQTSPTVSTVGVPAGGTYRTGQNLDFTVNFNEAVTVDTTGGTPYVSLTLDTGGTVHAVYFSGSGTASLVFRYTVIAGNSDSNGITVGNLSPNDGTFRDTAGNDAELVLHGLGNTDLIRVDAVAPIVSSVSAVDGVYGMGRNLDFTVNFSENVTVDTTGGTPYITVSLDTGGDVRASYISGSGTTALVFRYQIVSGDSDTDGVGVGGSITANGGTLKDAVGNDATLTLKNIGSMAQVQVDTVGPEITFVKPTEGATLNTNNGSMVIVNLSDLGSEIDASSIELQIDSGSWTDPISVVGNTVYFLLGQLGNGSHTLTVRARDNAGNETIQTITITWNHYRRGFGFGRFSF